jgi:DNA replicative helicase MCM subunit Mcm2 (Cdc46/Mcm family)
MIMRFRDDSYADEPYLESLPAYIIQVRKHVVRNPPKSDWVSSLVTRIQSVLGNKTDYTSREVQSIHRIEVAFARLKFHDIVTKEDSLNAIDLVCYSVCHKHPKQRELERVFLDFFPPGYKRIFPL